MFVAHSGVFLEKELLTKGTSGRSVRLEEVQDDPVGDVSTSDAIVAKQVEEPMVIEAPQPRRLARLHEARELILLDNDEPATYAEAMVDPDFEKWLIAMRSEIESMGDNQVWNLVDLPDGFKAIECKWIYKKKIDVDGNVHIHKA